MSGDADAPSLAVESRRAGTRPHAWVRRLSRATVALLTTTFAAMIALSWIYPTESQTPPGVSLALGFAILTAPHVPSYSWGGLSAPAAVILLAYLFGMRMVFLDQRISAQTAAVAAVATKESPTRPALWKPVVGFLIGAAVLLILNAAVPNLFSGLIEKISGELTGISVLP